MASNVIKGHQQLSSLVFSELNHTDHASMSRCQMEIDLKEWDYELSQSLSIDGNGIFFTKLGTEESMMNNS